MEIKIIGAYLLATFFALSSPVSAQGYMNVKMGASVQFTYMQIVNLAEGHFMVGTNVTEEVPHNIQSANSGKILVIL